MARKGNRKSGSKSKDSPRIYFGKAAGGPRKKRPSYDWASAAWVVMVLLVLLVVVIWLSMTDPIEPQP